MNAWGELANAARRQPRCAGRSRRESGAVAVAVEGLPTLLLPAERVTAVHEAGHAVLHAAQGNRPSGVRIWPHRAGQGYAGTCDFPLDAPALCIYPLQQPHQALARACVTLAGWAAEWRFEREGFRLGSSLNERVVAGGWVQGAALALHRDPEVLLAALLQPVRPRDVVARVMGGPPQERRL